MSEVVYLRKIGKRWSVSIQNPGEIHPETHDEDEPMFETAAAALEVGIGVSNDWGIGLAPLGKYRIPVHRFPPMPLPELYFGMEPVRKTACISDKPLPPVYKPKKRKP